MKFKELLSSLIIIIAAIMSLLSFCGINAEELKAIYITQTEETETISETIVPTLAGKTVSSTHLTLPPETTEDCEISDKSVGL